MMASVTTPLPRITIQFCTQCKWMLRAAYFAQELLSTFSTAIGEVALQPSTGGTFVVELFYAPPDQSVTDDEPLVVQRHVLWDRKTEGGFPETKVLKQRVRNVIDPTRDLGHVDGKKKSVVVIQEDDSPSNQASQAATPQEYESQGQDSGLQQEEQKQPARRPRAISNLQAAVGDGERKFTPMDVDGAEMAYERGEGEQREEQVKRNPDGSICEDCQ